jgi:hypothetical protein
LTCKPIDDVFQEIIDQDYKECEKCLNQVLLKKSENGKLYSHNCTPKLSFIQKLERRIHRLRNSRFRRSQKAINRIVDQKYNQVFKCEMCHEYMKSKKAFDVHVLSCKFHFLWTLKNEYNEITQEIIDLKSKNTKEIEVKKSIKNITTIDRESEFENWVLEKVKPMFEKFKRINSAFKVRGKNKKLNKKINFLGIKEFLLIDQTVMEGKNELIF